MTSFKQNSNHFYTASRFNLYIAFCIFLFTILIVYFSKNYSFFYDNTSQVSIPANWFYSHGFSTLFVPDASATGHPTLMGIYIAITWKLFGYSLITAHWAMAPFIFGFFWQSYLFLRRLFSKNTQIIAGLLILVTDACILSQSSLITFEIPLIFFFVLAFNAILSGKKWILAITSFFLCLISLRGTITCAGLLIFDVIFTYSILKKNGFKRLILYAPGFIAISTYLFIHFLNRGWAIHNTVSQAWETSAQFATPPIILKNIAILIMRIFEYGRIFIALVFLLMIWKIKLIKTDIQLKTILLAAASQAILFFPLVIAYQNPFSTRYFLPFIVLINIAAAYFLLTYYKKIILVVLFILINISGYFIIYPQKLAMPWDCTPAHWPYYTLRENMLQYTEKQKIKPEDISGGFSIYGDQKIKDLKRTYTITQEPFKKYYIHTNISNSTDELLEDIGNNNKWLLLKRIEKRGVFIELYKRNEK